MRLENILPSVHEAQQGEGVRFNSSCTSTSKRALARMQQWDCLNLLTTTSAQRYMLHAIDSCTTAGPMALCLLIDSGELRLGDC
jgi:hypothetical protein